MVNTIWEDLKRQYYSGNIITQLLLINIGVFLFFRFVWLGMWITGFNPDNIQNILEWFMVSGNGFELITRPWTIITNMFLHFDLGHIFWNMLYLYWFGRILQELIGNRKILAIYVLSGLAGVVAFVLSANLTTLPIGDYALGASGAIMGLVLAAATTAPNFQIHLIFIGGVKLMYIALIVVVLDLIALPGGVNTGGHLAHLGGAGMGYFLARQMQNGNDWTERFNIIFDKIVNWFQNTFSRRSRPKVVYRNPNKVKTRTKAAGRQRPGADSLSKDERQARVDAILDKIKREGGYNNLTDEEKEFLFKAGKDD